MGIPQIIMALLLIFVIGLGGYSAWRNCSAWPVFRRAFIHDLSGVVLNLVVTGLLTWGGFWHG